MFRDGAETGFHPIKFSNFGFQVESKFVSYKSLSCNMMVSPTGMLPDALKG